MRVLIFGTCYVDTEAKQIEIRNWCDLHSRLNPDCDLLLVDSNSPLPIVAGHVRVNSFEDNIGHLSRGGQDGWGRAFTHGLQVAMEEGYDYVVHIEGDNLFRHPASKFCEFMQKQNIQAFVTTVNGTKWIENNWIETGIMFFSLSYLKSFDFIRRYNWTDGASKQYPHTPEAVIWEILSEDHALDVVPITVMRDDCNRLTTSNVKRYDWITHTTLEIYQAFIESVVSSEHA